MLTDSDALIEADRLLLMLVLADWLALIDALTLLLMLVLADTDAESLALTDAEAD